MKHTTNYNLNKIELTDSPPDITALNPNFDTIDAQLKSLVDKDAEIVASINTVKNDYLPKTGGNVTNGLTVKNKTVAVSVNGSTADANGNITIDVGGKVQSVNGVTPDSNGNVAIEFGGGDVQSVDGVEPDTNGNVALNASTRDEILEGAKRVTDVQTDASVAQIQALQTAVARAESNIDSKLPNTTAHIVESWVSGNNWYRKWSDGWIEQGGLTSTMAHQSKLTFNTAFSNKNYVFAATGNFDTYNWVYINTYSRTTSNCMLSIVRGGDGISAPVSWYACGF